MTYELTEAVEHLCARDKRLAKWIEKIGAPVEYVSARGSIFEALAESIVYQQLAGRAAETIHGRVLALFPRKKIKPELLLAMSDEPLRAAGLSANKLLALRDLARHAVEGSLPDKKRAARMSDEELIERCSAVRGVGRWTVEMLLIFRLGRPDVLPVDDYGVRKGFQRAFGLKDLPTKEQMNKRGEKWRPYRSLASWYMWRVTELPKAAKSAK